MIADRGEVSVIVCCKVCIWSVSSFCLGTEKLDTTASVERIKQCLHVRFGEYLGINDSSL